MRTRARRIAVRVSEEQYNKISRLTERSFFTKEQVLRDIIRFRKTESLNVWSLF